MPILSAYFWYVLPSGSDGRTYQMSNIDLLLTECIAIVAIFSDNFLRVHQLTQIRALSVANTQSINVDQSLREEQRRKAASNTPAIFDRETIKTRSRSTK